MAPQFTDEIIACEAILKALDSIDSEAPRIIKKEDVFEVQVEIEHSESYQNGILYKHKNTTVNIKSLESDRYVQVDKATTKRPKIEKIKLKKDRAKSKKKKDSSLHTFFQCFMQCTGTEPLV